MGLGTCVHEKGIVWVSLGRWAWGVSVSLEGLGMCVGDVCGCERCYELEDMRWAPRMCHEG